MGFFIYNQLVTNIVFGRRKSASNQLGVSYTMLHPTSPPWSRSEDHICVSPLDAHNNPGCNHHGMVVGENTAALNTHGKVGGGVQ
jgi:hypothetical protein